MKRDSLERNRYEYLSVDESWLYDTADSMTRAELIVEVRRLLERRAAASRSEHEACAR